MAFLPNLILCEIFKWKQILIVFRCHARPFIQQFTLLKKFLLESIASSHRENSINHQLKGLEVIQSAIVLLLRESFTGIIDEFLDDLLYIEVISSKRRISKSNKIINCLHNLAWIIVVFTIFKFSWQRTEQIKLITLSIISSRNYFFEHSAWPIETILRIFEE